MNKEVIFEDEIQEKESLEDKIFGYQAEIDQMNRMIEENKRQIALNDDVFARENMIKVLTNEIKKKEKEISKLQAAIDAEA